MEKATRAYVSYVRGYKEHHCSYIFRLAVRRGWGNQSVNDIYTCGYLASWHHQWHPNGAGVGWRQQVVLCICIASYLYLCCTAAPLYG